MNFELTDDQRSIQRTARDFLASSYPPAEVRRLAYDTERGFEDAGWAAICELGWPALLVPEEHGGLGLGVVELAVVQEELGAALAPSPFLSTVSAAAVIADAGTDEQRERWLPALAAGEARGAVATVLDDVGWTAVPDAEGADVIVVRENDAWSLATETSAEPVEALDPTRRLWRVRAEGQLESLAGEGERAFDIVAAALAAETVGAALEAEQAVAHVRLQVREDEVVVADQVELRVAVDGPEDLVRVRDADGERRRGRAHVTSARDSTSTRTASGRACGARPAPAS